MANRILLGKSGSDYVLKVSQPGDNVLSPSEPLLFDSTSVRSGMVFAGGNESSTTGKNWSSVKGTLGYIPLIISADDNRGSKETYSNDVELFYNKGDVVASTTTSLIPKDPDMDMGGRTATNLKFMVLRIPLQYGKMTDASLWS